MSLRLTARTSPHGSCRARAEALAHSADLTGVACRPAESGTRRGLSLFGAPPPPPPRARRRRGLGDGTRSSFCKLRTSSKQSGACVTAHFCTQRARAALPSTGGPVHHHQRRSIRWAASSPNLMVMPSPLASGCRGPAAGRYGRHHATHPWHPVRCRSGRGCHRDRQSPWQPEHRSQQPAAADSHAVPAAAGHGVCRMHPAQVLMALRLRSASNDIGLSNCNYPNNVWLGHTSS